MALIRGEYKTISRGSRSVEISLRSDTQMETFTSARFNLVLTSGTAPASLSVSMKRLSMEAQGILKLMKPSLKMTRLTAIHLLTKMEIGTKDRHKMETSTVTESSYLQTERNTKASSKMVNSTEKELKFFLMEENTSGSSKMV